MGNQCEATVEQFPVRAVAFMSGCRHGVRACGKTKKKLRGAWRAEADGSFACAASGGSAG